MPANPSIPLHLSCNPLPTTFVFPYALSCSLEAFHCMRKRKKLSTWLKMRQNYILLQSQAHHLGQQAWKIRRTLQRGRPDREMDERDWAHQEFPHFGGISSEQKQEAARVSPKQNTVRATVLRDVKRLLKLGFAGNRQTCVACRKWVLRSLFFQVLKTLVFFLLASVNFAHYL